MIAIAGAGCSGSAEVQLVSIHRMAIDPPAVDVQKFHANECYWWIEDSGNLNIAIRCKRFNPLAGRLGGVEVNMSWVLGKPPAGSGRDYRVRAGMMRAIIETPLETHRFVFYSGMVKVLVADNDQMEGSFRIFAVHRGGFSPLLLLQGPRGNFMFFGTFRAVKDPERGRAIVERTDSAGGHRPAPEKVPTTTTQAAGAAESGLRGAG